MMPKVFISYTWESESHNEWVTRFAADLIELGIEVQFDQFDVGYGDSFLRFMVTEIHRSNFFLFVSTNESKKVADVEEERDARRGLWFELEQARTRASEDGLDFKEICVLREGDHPPRYFAQRKYLDLRDDKKYRLRLHKFSLFLKFGRYKPARVEYDATFAVNNISVPDIVPEYTFIGKNALSSQEFRCVYEDVWTPLPDRLTVTKEHYIDRKRKEAIKDGITFDNNLSYSLHTVSVEREQGVSGYRRNRYTLHLRPTDYFSFVFPNLSLDETIEIGDNKTTPREVLGLAHHRMRIENLVDYPCHFHIGTGTVFITSDNRIAISIRSRLQFVVGGSKYHLSAAEGMLRPVDEQNGEISPFLTSIRSLEDELGLERGVDFIEDDIRCLGLLLDTLRAQPFCSFYVRSNLISFNELRDKWQLQAKDKHENKDVIGMDWNEDTARILIRGCLDHLGTLVEVASNHAQSGFMLAALHEFGEAATLE